MASTQRNEKICIEVLPDYCCIVPEKREELTTEGGLNVIKKFKIPQTVCERN